MADDPKKKLRRRARERMTVGADDVGDVGRLLGAELERAGAELDGAEPLDVPPPKGERLTYPGRPEGAAELTRERPTSAERARRMLEQLAGGRRRVAAPEEKTETASTPADAADAGALPRRRTKRERREQRRKGSDVP